MDSEPQYMVIDDTIDLRPYLLGLLRFWPLLLGIPVLAMIGAVLGIRLGEPVYEARVGVAIVRYQTNFALEPTLTTEMDPGAQREALADLAENPAIAREVIRILGDRLPEEYREIGRLMEMVTAQAQKGDLVEISLRARDPDVAVMVVETWAGAYEEHINEVYSGIAPGAIETISKQAERAKPEYERAEQALVAFAEESPIDELSRAISERQQVLDTLKDARVREIREATTRREKVRSLLRDARGLLAASQAGGEATAASTGLAITLLKTEAYATSSSLPGNLTLQMPVEASTSPDAAAQQRDLRALVAALEREAEDLDATLRAYLSVGDTIGGGGTPLTEGVPALEAELRTLRSELEAAQALERELTRARDLAWETYTALTRKLAEQQVESELTRNVVRVATEPLRPDKPVARASIMQTVALAGVGAFAVAVLVALFVLYLFPDFDPASLWRGSAEAATSASDPEPST